ITHSKLGGIFSYEWSPRGNFIAFDMPAVNGFRAVHIWSASDHKIRRVTSEYFNSFSPSWDPDGNFLYYLSNHEFAPQISSVEFNYATNRQTGIYAMALRKDVKHPFPAESDEVKLDA